MLGSRIEQDVSGLLANASPSGDQSSGLDPVACSHREFCAQISVVFVDQSLNARVVNQSIELPCIRARKDVKNHNANEAACLWWPSVPEAQAGGSRGITQSNVATVVAKTKCIHRLGRESFKLVRCSFRREPALRYAQVDFE